jgi:hypothetical protein
MTTTARLARTSIFATLLVMCLVVPFLAHPGHRAFAAATDPVYPTITDYFSRANQTFWGSSSDGDNQWSGDAFVNTNFTISSEHGVVSSCGCIGVSTLGPTSYPDSDTLIQGKDSGFTVYTSGSADYFGAMARIDGTSSFGYIAFIDGTNLGIAKYNSGTITALATTSFSASNNTVYDVRFDVVGTTLEAKAWDVTAQGEPSSWMVSTTDSSYTDGGAGLFNYSRSPNTQTFNLVQVGQIADSTSLDSSYREPNAYDQFDRDDQSGWGTLEDGFNSWGGCLDTNGSISSGVATYTGTGIGTCNVNAGNTVADSDIFATMNLSTLGTNDRFGLIGRKQSGVNSQYNLVFDGASLKLAKVVSGTSTTLATATVSGTSGTDYTFHLHMSGTTITASVWAADSTEPGTPQISVTDSTFSSGEPGIQTFTKTVGNVLTVTDFFSYNV